MPLYWLIERHVYKRLVLPREQLITNLTRGNTANENLVVVRQLTQVWLNMTYIGETETSLTQLTAKLTLEKRKNAPLGCFSEWFSSEGDTDLLSFSYNGTGLYEELTQLLLCAAKFESDTAGWRGQSLRVCHTREQSVDGVEFGARSVSAHRRTGFVAYRY